jgi:hypothetical protein
MSTRILLGVKTVGAVGGDDFTTFIMPKVEKIRSLNLPDPEGPAQACSGKTLPTSLSRLYVHGVDRKYLAFESLFASRRFVYPNYSVSCSLISK